MKVLDVGCGRDPSPLIARVSFLKITSWDSNTYPILWKKPVCSPAAQGVTNVSFENGDIHTSPFADDSFDVSPPNQVLQHIADPIRALQEMRHVTKLGGVVACRESASMTWYPDSEKLNALYELARRTAIAKGGNPHPGKSIRIWAEKAGFTRINITKSTGSWCFNSDEGTRIMGRIHGREREIIRLCDNDIEIEGRVFSS